MSKPLIVVLSLLAVTILVVYIVTITTLNTSLRTEKIDTKTNDIEIEYLNSDGTVKQTKKVFHKSHKKSSRKYHFQIILSFIVGGIIFAIFEDKIKAEELTSLLIGTTLFILSLNRSENKKERVVLSVISLIGTLFFVNGLLSFTATNPKMYYFIVGFPLVVNMVIMFFRFIEDFSLPFVILYSFFSGLILFAMAILASLLFFGVGSIVLGSVFFLLGFIMTGYAIYVLINKLLKL